MKGKLLYILFPMLLLVMYSCSGEDRTYEYEEKTVYNHWIYERMADKYLWADTLSEPAWKKFFGAPSAFLSSLTAKGRNDKWSYLVVDTINSDPHSRGYFNHNDSYGFDFVLMTDPTGMTTKQYVRVTTVYPGSPAERCGLRRGDFIMSYDGYKLTSNNVSRLQKGEQRTLTVCHLSADEAENVYLWDDALTYMLPPSERVKDVPFPAYDILNVAGITTAYLMCNRLTDDVIEQGGDDTAYRNELSSIMGGFADAQVSELVLDLRLCNNGALEIARLLASYIVDPDYKDSVFAKTVWNRANSANNLELRFDTGVRNLSLGRIFVLTSRYTQGPAEWIINSLRSLMGAENVITIGETTAGQSVMTQYVGHDHLISLYPAVAYVTDGKGNCDYSSGIAPDYQVREMNSLYLGQYGEADEPLLNMALYLIAN